MPVRIGVINYGFGNLASVRNALNFLEIDHGFVDDPHELKNFGKLILPGVGAFGAAMSALREKGMDDAIQEYHTLNNGELLGICLGMQLLFDYSLEHGHHTGLGLIQGGVKPLQSVTNQLPVPNVGWCFIREATSNSRLLAGIEESALCFYFVHSFFCDAEDKHTVTGQLDYGVECSVVVESNSVSGCQFHPEKSQQSGLTLLRNFAEN